MPALNYDFTKFEAYKDLNIDDVIIPTTDDSAWEYFCNHNWIYDKLLLSQLNDIPCAPYGVYPTEYPVIVKPITNLLGGGTGSRKVSNEEELEKYLLPGFFWMNYFEGDHLSFDCIVKEGKVIHMEVFEGHKLRDGMFDYWETITEEVDSARINKIVKWTRTHLSDYTGCLCCETIDDNIIEAHLRMGDLDRLMNVSLMENIINIYKGQSWNYKQRGYKKYYLFTLFGPHTLKARLKDTIISEVSEKCVFFQLDPETGASANPPSGKRLLVFGTWDKEEGIKIRNYLIKNIRPRIPDEYVSSLLGYKKHFSLAKYLKFR